MKRLFASILAFLALSVFGWECGDTSQPRPQLSTSATAVQPEVFSALRLEFSFQTEPSAELAKAAEAVKRLFKANFYVHPVAGPINLAGIRECGPELQIPANHQVNGVTNADLVIYVTESSLPASAGDGYSAACVVADSAENVLAGGLVLNSERTMHLKELTDFVLHLTAHVIWPDL